MLCGTEFRERGLEFLHHRAADESGGAQGTAKDFREFRFEFRMRSNEIKEWYFVSF
jgi:hypothetical protein